VSGSLGALDLQAAAVKLESVMKQEKLPETLTLLEAFDSELKIVIDGLKELAEAAETTIVPESEKEAGSVSLLLELLKKLEPHLQKREPMPSKEIVAELSRYRWPGNYSETIGELSKLISKYKFKDAQQVLTTLSEIVTIPKRFHQE
ncbi:MAG: hypothetical protein HQ517_17235, partial [SAR324 cluster bacterium]|nr:hypothetical protein [SAR324 cluster bacterium]